MSRVVFILLFFLCFFTLNAQNHVAWKGSWDEKNKQVVIVGTIDPTWHLYSPKTDPGLGPIPLNVTFQKTKGLKRKGALEFLTEPIAHADENFGGMVYIWENHIEIRQSFKVKTEGYLSITLNYMICDETMCIPPIDVPLTLRIKK